MVNTGALLYGTTEVRQRHLQMDACEHPVALQLGGNKSADLAACAKIGQDWGYDEINLNCGCPSSRVQHGAFGACLMLEPQLVADCVKAMLDVVTVPITIKHRIGLDREESYDFVRDFVGTVATAGCQTFIVHARNAWLDGLSPKENREIPPLRYDIVYQLKRDFPSLTIVLNGGVVGNAQIDEHLQHVDGVMIGRAAYHNPWLLTQWDAQYFGSHLCTLTMSDVETQLENYMERKAQLENVHWWSIARHMLGLRHGLPKARLWRQAWSDHQLKNFPPKQVWRIVRERLNA
jgi:tRNA-dihydrouridine synthase A